jgi:hypothetical protein
MPPVNQPPPSEDSPPATPETATTWKQFGAALRALRDGRDLTITALEAKNPDALRRSTISAYELGNGRPTLGWTRIYVTACLRHRNPTLTPERLTAELSRWETAWTRLNREAVTPASPPPAPAAPEPRPTNPNTPPAPVSHNQPPATADTTAADDEPKSRRVRLPHGRVMLVGGGVVVLVVAAAITATVTDLFNPGLGPEPARFAGTTIPAVAVHASGQIDNLRGVEGIDLDTNGRADQEAPGVDISPAATATHLNAMANRVTFTVLPEHGAETRERCVKAVDWMRQIPNIYDLTEGRNICVITDENRFSMLTITRRSSAASPIMNFHYTTWN